ncbi:unnamed protein product [Phaedon cochleariae]|uniref:Max-binding protein MNT n=1 Tax=Phaedon cochleariae TaxID=80249 RepID=A0A9N9X656_PHACE|nr:unnamed protein product [Phaedon cochleariae]
MSSLSTLLEAAKFLELQEQHHQQSRETVAETLVTMKPAPPAHTRSPPAHTRSPPTPSDQLHPKTDAASPQTVVISSSNSIGHQAIIQGPIAFTSTSPAQFAKKIEQDMQVSSTTTVSQQLPRRILHNSFDIRNPLVVDESAGCDSNKRKQPPMVFRAGTREVHNKLEKHRRAHLKECFDVLKKQLPASQDEKKTSNLSILHSALRYIQTLKRKERELEHEMERLAREKITSQQRLAVLKKEISSRYDNVDFSKLLPEMASPSPSSSLSHHESASAGEFNEGVCVGVGVGVDMGVGVPSGPVIDKVAIPILAKAGMPMVKHHLTTLKEVSTATSPNHLPLGPPDVVPRQPRPRPPKGPRAQRPRRPRAPRLHALHRRPPSPPPTDQRQGGTPRAVPRQAGGGGQYRFAEAELVVKCWGNYRGKGVKVRRRRGYLRKVQNDEFAVAKVI